MADATVKTTMTLPGHSSLSPSVDVLAGDAAGQSGLDLGFSGIRPRVNPLASLASGSSHRGRATSGRAGATARSPSTATG